jgi:serine/threonine-protein kinase
VSSERDRLRETLSARGVAADASVHETLGLKRAVVLPDPGGLPVARAELGSEFMLREEIGRGGMASVWAATQRALNREVAIKRASDPDDREAEQLLLREAIVTGQLEHPNIVPIHQLVLDAQGPAVVMKRIAGKSWQSLIEDPRVTLEQHLDVFLQTLNAVGFAHSRGVLHRDIKPENVMIGAWGEVYLLDWGVAKRAQDPASSAIVGTPCYMAPEMADGQADERTDVFLLGATLHEVLTGEPRHDGESALDVLYAAMYVEPHAYSASVPSELAAICNRACARAPEARFAAVGELRDAVLRFREHRAANALTESALALHAQLQLRCDEAAREAYDYNALQRLFGETRLGFEAALRIWPESPGALEGLDRCLGAMVEYELSQGHLEAAEALHAVLRSPAPALLARLSEARELRASERERLLRSERDRDPSVGALARTRAYLSMGGVTALMTLALLARRVWLADQALSTLRLTLIGGAVLAIMLVVALLWRRFGAFNLINRRIAAISISTLAVSFASRLSGYLTDTAPERVLITDAFLLGLGGLALMPYHPAGPWLAVTSFVVALVGSLQPGWVDDLFIGLSVLVPAALFLLKSERLLPREPAAQHDALATPTSTSAPSSAPSSP